MDSFFFSVSIYYWSTTLSSHLVRVSLFTASFSSKFSLCATILRKTSSLRCPRYIRISVQRDIDAFLWGVAYVACMGQVCLSMLETYKRSQNLEWNTWLVIPCLFVVCYRLLVLLAVIFSFVQYIVDKQLFSHSRPGRVKFQVSLELLYNCFFFFKITWTAALLQALCLSWLAFMVAIIYIFLLLICSDNGKRAMFYSPR